MITPNLHQLLLFSLLAVVSSFSVLSLDPSATQVVQQIAEAVLRKASELSTQLALLPERSLQLDVDVVVQDSPGRGKGVFALRDIEAPGTLLAPYFGQLVTNVQIEASADNSYNAYLFALDEERCIDGADPRYSNWVRYLNHSRRRTNCQADVIVGVGSPGGRTTGVVIRSTRPIAAGQELFLDYGDQYWQSKVPNPLERLKIHYG